MTTMGSKSSINPALYHSAVLTKPTMPSFLEALTLTPSTLLTLTETCQKHHLLLSLSFCTIILLFSLLSLRPNRVFLLDYSCYNAPPDRRCTYELCEYMVARTRRVSLSSQQFTREVYSKSGLGDETNAPPLLWEPDLNRRFPSAFREAEEGLFSTVDSLLGKTCVKPHQIDILVVACSMFFPSPSLSSMIVNRFKFKPNIKSFNLSGMGCSAGGIAIDMAASILKRKSGYALIVTTENTSLNLYFGDERSMIVTNCIFRVGSSAILISSDKKKLGDSKMELLKSLRTHHGNDDAAYGAALQQEDQEGMVGVALTKDLVRVAGAALRNHIATLAPRVLPVSELLRYGLAMAKSLLLEGKIAKDKVPDFLKAFEHICLHPGGKAVVNAVGRLMKLPESAVEPARMTLHKFGNTSSSSVFYELGYFEVKKRIKKGDRVWMLSFGTGFKACSLVWRCLKEPQFDPVNPWNACAFRYPVKPSSSLPKSFVAGIDNQQ